MRIPKYNSQFSLTDSYYITVEVEDLADYSAHIFQTFVSRWIPKYSGGLKVVTTICRLKPETPGYSLLTFS